MRRVPRLAMSAVLLAAVAVGCADQAKKDATPNPDLKVPDVPPGGHGSKAEMKDMTKKNK